MTMDPAMMIALASVLGALVFMAAGYVMGGRPSRATDTVEEHNDLEASSSAKPLAPTVFRAEPAGADVPAAANSDRRDSAAAADSFPSMAVVEPLTVGSMQELLLHLAEQTVSFRVALFDEDGLLVDFVGGPPGPAVGALVGLFARSLHGAREANLVHDTSVLELHDAEHGTVRLRTIHWDGQTFVLTSIGPHRRRASPTEDAVGAAIPTLLAAG